MDWPKRGLKRAIREEWQGVPIIYIKTHTSASLESIPYKTCNGIQLQSHPQVGVRSYVYPYISLEGPKYKSTKLYPILPACVRRSKAPEAPERRASTIS